MGFNPLPFPSSTESPNEGTGGLDWDLHSLQPHRKALERTFSHPSCSSQWVLGHCEEYKLFHERWDEEGEEEEERLGWKNSQDSAHISFSKQNVWFLFQLHPFALRSHLRVKLTVRCGANFLLRIKMHWMLQNEVDCTGLAGLQITSLWCKPA